MNLLQRLRYHGGHCLDRNGEQSRTMLEAADEIERMNELVLNLALSMGVEEIPAHWMKGEQS